MRVRRFVVTALAVVLAAGTLPGCMFSIGSTVESDARVKKLEERIARAEEKLGIAAPAEAGK